ncbi:MAG: sulfite exporter TauE/SafE family protein [Thiocapsa sp.]|nr:sulfite exporter TauE/SafE family protein [Thiocapsa sp.]MCG6985799.1 sulfite exporter TauE/SafE family protein [Thiocapsa sp.]
MSGPVDVGLTLPLAFLTGALGALHCLGMCSGLAGGFFVRCGGGIVPVLSYHGTRILVYGVLGAAGAIAGRVLVQQGIIGKGQGLLMIVAGLIIVGLGLSLVWPPTGPSGCRIGSFETPAMQKAVSLNSKPLCSRPWHAAVAGAFNGLVPCSLTVSIAIKAAATADPLRAGVLMVVFGLGTLPTMGLVSLTGTAIGRKVRGLSAKLAGLAVIVLGLWTLYEGWVFFDIMRGLSNW